MLAQRGPWLKKKQSITSKRNRQIHSRLNQFNKIRLFSERLMIKACLFKNWLKR